MNFGLGRPSFLDPHITNANVQVDGHGDVWFVVNDTVNARFEAKEPEPTPPAGFEVEAVVFGGRYMDVTYRVTKPIAVVLNLFYPENDRKLFEAYREGILQFAAYRNKILRRTR